MVPRYGVFCCLSCYIWFILLKSHLHLIVTLPQGLMGTIHEGGHAMYEQNLQDSDLGIDEALSMGVHESQSLFWERHIGKSKEFYKFARPILTEAFNTEERSSMQL